MTKIYLIRHAEAEGNLYRIMHGQTNSSITETGLQQIEALSRRFANIPIDACYASDLIRTQTTAKAITGPKGLPLQLDARFREVQMGRWEGLTFGYLYHHEPETMKIFSQEPQKWQVEGAESYDTYTSRFLEGLTELAQKHDGQTIAIVSHAMVMRVSLQRLFADEEPDRDFDRCDNTAVTFLEYANQKFHLRYLYDNSHLEPAISTLARQSSYQKDGKKLDYSLWFQPIIQCPEVASAFLGASFSILPSRRGILAMFHETPVGYLEIEKANDSMEAGRIWKFRFEEAYNQSMYQLQMLGESVVYYRTYGVNRLQVVLEDVENAGSFFQESGFLQTGVTGQGTTLEKNIEVSRYL